MSTSWEQEKALFLGALEQEDVAREGWVRQQTGDDAALRDAVLSLLAAHDPADGFLETPAAALAAHDLPDVLPESGRVGVYRLIREIGRGGMGTVYLASRDDGEFHHEVAVKLVKRGMDTDLILARFRRERQILAGLDHPNIARLLDGGTTDRGLPYFVMEYVPGVPVREYVAAHTRSIDQLLTLFGTICAAVEHAHRSLVVHRDLKSGNILVTAQGVPKLLDFGIAKLLDPSSDDAERGSTTMLALTPEYASPEQLRGEPVTTATDVYSLGVMLYELLTGRRPFEAPGRRIDELARLVCETDAPRPSDRLMASDPRRARQLRGDLDTIVMMAMHKDRARRYASVAQLAEDIVRYQRGLAVRAQPDRLGYRTAKFVRRHRTGVAAGLLVTLSLIGGLAASLWQARVASAERTRAERRFAEVRALATTFLFDVHDAIRTLPGSTPARALLVQRGLASLDGLARESQGDPALQRDLAIAYQRVGDVQGNSYGANLGDTEGALRSYRSAVALLERAGAERSPDPDTKHALVEGYRGLAAILIITGELQDAMRYFARALALQRPLVAAWPARADYRTTLANLLQEQGDVLGGPGISNVGDTQGALASYRESVALREAMWRSAPASVDLKAGLASAYLMLGSLTWTLHDTLGATRVQRGIEMLEQIVAERPDDAVRRNELLSGYGRLRVPLVDAGRYEAAIAIDRKVVAMLLPMVSADPQNTLLQRNLSVSHNSLGRDLRAAGHADRAVASHREALAIAERLRRADTSSIEHQRDVAFTEDVYAEALADAGDVPRALAMYDRAIASKRALQRAEPSNPWHADDLAFLLAGLGTVRVATGAFAEAERAYREAVPLAEAAVTRQEGSPKAKATLASMYGGVALLHVRQSARSGSADARGLACSEAARWYEKSDRLWRELAAGNALTTADRARRGAVGLAMRGCAS